MTGLELRKDQLDVPLLQQPEIATLMQGQSLGCQSLLCRPFSKTTFANKALLLLRWETVPAKKLSFPNHAGSTSYASVGLYKHGAQTLLLAAQACKSGKSVNAQHAPSNSSGPDPWVISH